MLQQATQNYGWIYSAFLLYVSLLVCIGLSVSYFMKRNESHYLLGGRSINFWVTALSAHASDMSSWLFLGLPVAIYLHGLNECWVAVGLVLGMAFAWTFLAQPLRKQSELLSAQTLNEFFAAKVEASWRYPLKLISAFCSVFFFIFYIASGFQGIATLLYSVLNIPSFWSIVIVCFLVIVYATKGGYSAVAMTDAFQALFSCL